MKKNVILCILADNKGINSPSLRFSIPAIGRKNVLTPSRPFLAIALVLFTTIFATSCSKLGIPEGVKPVKDFDQSRYLGKWYEIARLDHPFERGLINVTAEYSKWRDGAILVINRGYNPGTGKWKSVKGKAYFVESPETGRLKVTFFWPIYGAYNIIALDKQDYSYAMVCGHNLSSLWILSRNKKMDSRLQKSLVYKAKNLGFQTENLIYVEQNK